MPFNEGHYCILFYWSPEKIDRVESEIIFCFILKLSYHDWN